MQALQSNLPCVQNEWPYNLPSLRATAMAQIKNKHPFIFLGIKIPQTFWGELVVTWLKDVLNRG